MVGGLELGHDNGSNMIDAENAVAGPGLDAQADPSRVLFVKHIPTSVADEELGGMFRVRLWCSMWLAQIFCQQEHGSGGAASALLMHLYSKQ